MVERPAAGAGIADGSGSKGLARVKRPTSPSSQQSDVWNPWPLQNWYSAVDRQLHVRLGVHLLWSVCNALGDNRLVDRRRFVVGLFGGGLFLVADPAFL